MSWVVFVVRILVGGMFLFSSISFFGKFMEPKPPEQPLALGFITALGMTKYMTVIKLLELVGGLFVLIGRLAPLGLTMLVPVTVNIALWDALLVEFSGPPVGVIMLVLEVFLLVAYRKYFASVFTTSAEAGF